MSNDSFRENGNKKGTDTLYQEETVGILGYKMRKESLENLTFDILKAREIEENNA